MNKIVVNLMGSALVTLMAATASASPMQMVWTGRGFIPLKGCAEETSVRNGFRIRGKNITDYMLVPRDELAGTQDLSDYVMEMKGKAPVKNLTPKISILNTFWQVRMSGNLFKNVVCGADKKVFATFDVYSRQQIAPIATVAVSAKDAELFRSIEIQTVEDAEKKIAAPLDKENRTDKRNVGNGVTRVKPSKPAATTTTSTTARPTARPVPSALTPVTPATPPPGAATPNDDKMVTGSTSASTGSTATTPTVAAPQTTAPAKPLVPGVSENQGIDSLICLQSGELQVRDEKLEKVLFNASKLETVKAVQSFGAEKKKLKVGDKTYTFVKVQFPKRDAGKNVGWVAEQFVKLSSECAFAPKVKPATPAPRTEIDRDGDNKITGIDDEDCCVFPTNKRPTTSYREGMRRFRAGRSGGRRLHAACDLYRLKGEEAVAIAPGQVLRGLYFFYQGTYAIEVMHAGGFVARYGEVTGRAAANVGAGARVNAGQTVGYIGKVNSNCCEPMLHFELYSGRLKGASLSGGGGFQRRADLMDPTAYLRKWEMRKFGESF